MVADWRERTFSLSSLRSEQAYGEQRGSVLGWLKSLGIVPRDVAPSKRKVKQLRLFLDSSKIDAGYLFENASEWDSWGPSRPRDFLDALEMETAGVIKQDTIMETLRALGREVEEDAMTEYKVHLPSRAAVA